ncbi:uncharacterized protein LOC141664014 [Apium graveolens]|uniref:uncharacterized protein LOC141664014 n=1 Tax=Apium graveolens TaxID=4045 RepID=UPI003D7A6A04
MGSTMRASQTSFSYRFFSNLKFSSLSIQKCVGVSEEMKLIAELIIQPFGYKTQGRSLQQLQKSVSSKHESTGTFYAASRLAGTKLLPHMCILEALVLESEM